MSMIGGELGELHGLSSNFQRQAGNVEDLMASLRGELGNVFWKGGAADRFRAAWDGEYEPALRNLAAALHEASGEIDRRSRALEAAGG